MRIRAALNKKERKERKGKKEKKEKEKEKRKGHRHTRLRCLSSLVALRTPQLRKFRTVSRVSPTWQKQYLPMPGFRNFANSQVNEIVPCAPRAAYNVAYSQPGRINSISRRVCGIYEVYTRDTLQLLVPTRLGRARARDNVFAIVQ